MSIKETTVYYYLGIVILYVTIFVLFGAILTSSSIPEGMLYVQGPKYNIFLSAFGGFLLANVAFFLFIGAVYNEHLKTNLKKIRKRFVAILYYISLSITPITSLLFISQFYTGNHVVLKSVDSTTRFIESRKSFTYFLLLLTVFVLIPIIVYYRFFIFNRKIVQKGTVVIFKDGVVAMPGEQIKLNAFLDNNFNLVSETQLLKTLTLTLSTPRVKYKVHVDGKLLLDFKNARNVQLSHDDLVQRIQTIEQEIANDLQNALQTFRDVDEFVRFVHEIASPKKFDYSGLPIIWQGSVRSGQVKVL
ncbi:MAG: hypothetical protein A3F94_03060 [Candidatus Spechtbacteria bacterium RIFCSPLOWO2_12_FULL_38_22]|uniref:Uncharacterized protein n=1 Tax=Candidatus Spechtbacteria bacterium RIFCSPLOWO2_12_FULL_38_22 TaxID=1802165 RepID=A0A1G2HI52_9BACT|nr:MAG: hypothetical protein A3E58_01490 [Candidatus Spechtbacteria bacterium RIFCSPHIGHO2_12_FULL_38_30]OGZ61115.1 MAG: hypothetical protein A3A00_01760 [Candidatus Spechtbacteria bacterium RIFCSPLOWO2_01_FULL_38_20]OGZ61960.1 MAG: hypothetical protein A3F94_03060 [Candidatus Spechtbacteria bacterium RIFCSPLOWO2_12_FULL_38_22]